MHNIDLIVYPELVAAALKSHEGDLYAIWLVLKAFDKEEGASGHVQHCRMLAFVKNFLQLSTTQSYKKLNEGQHKYWGSFAGKNGNKSTSLFSLERVANHLQPELIRTKPFGIPIYDLYSGEGWKDIRTILYSIVASRNEDLIPVSRATLCSNTGSSISTLYRRMHDKNKKGPNIYHNEVILEDSVMAEDIGEKKRFALDNGINSIFIKKRGCMYQLIKILPNSYAYPSNFDRLDIRTRPKALKQFDFINAANLSSKKYYDDMIKTHNNNSGYIYTGEHTEDRICPTRFWKQVGNNNVKL